MRCISLEQADRKPPFVKPWDKAQHQFACFVSPRRFLEAVVPFQPLSARALWLPPPREGAEELGVLLELDEKKVIWKDYFVQCAA